MSPELLLKGWHLCYPILILATGAHTSSLKTVITLSLFLCQILYVLTLQPCIGGELFPERMIRHTKIYNRKNYIDAYLLLLQSCFELPFLLCLYAFFLYNPAL